MRKATKDYNLEILYPESKSYWDYEKNIPLTPKEFLPKSQRKHWWKCPKGHCYRQTIAHFTSGIRCPYCTNKRASNSNNLLVTYPDVALKWNYEKNDLRPTDVLAGSDKKVWWKCNCGFEWEARIANISKRRMGCPKCQVESIKKNNIKLGIARNGALADKFPDLIGEWDQARNGELTPDALSIKSGIKIWWLCKKGHSWRVSIKSRVDRGGTGCPFCNSHASKQEMGLFYVLKDIFSDAISHHIIMGINVDVFIPSKVLIIELDGYYWHYKKKEKDIKKNKLLKEGGFRIIRVRDSRLKVLDNDSIVFDSKDSVKQIANNVLTHLLDNNFLSNGEKKKAQKLIDAPDSYFNSIAAHVTKEHFEVKREYSVAFLFPKLNEEFNALLNHGVSLENFTKGSNVLIYWTCSKCSDIWQAPISKRTQGIHNCPRCSRKIRGDRYKINATIKSGSFIDKCPSLSKEWNYERNTIDPKYLSPGSHVKAWWRCAEGHEWEAIIRSRSGGTGCPYCRGRRKH